MSEQPDFAEWLASEITRRGWTPPKFAAYVGKDYASVNRWLNGGGVDPTNVRLIAKVLLLPPEEVMRKLGWLPGGPNALAEDTEPYVVTFESEPIVELASKLHRADQARFREWLAIGELLLSRSLDGAA